MAPPWLSLLKRLLKVEGVQQNNSLADGWLVPEQPERRQAGVRVQLLDLNGRATPEVIRAIMLDDSPCHHSSR